MKDSFIIVLLVVVLSLVVSWCATAFMFWLITLCFDWTFKWSIATGIWLVLMVLSSWFKARKE